jgi:hypothetical protein
MAEMPLCSACKKPHWRFTACADVPALRREDYPIKTVPDGYRPFGNQLTIRDSNGWLIKD